MTQETLLYDVVHDYIISENFASDTEGANKIMLRLSDELIEEIYERTMTAPEKRKDTMLKKKYDDSDMKKNMQDQYGKEEGKKVYFATIRKQAMKKEEVEVVNEISSKTLSNYIKKGTKDIAKRASDDESHSGPKYGKKMSRMDGVMRAADKLAKKANANEEVEVVNEVSKKTLGSYVKKASTEMATSAMKGDYEKTKKRQSGVMKAADKLAKEENDIEEDCWDGYEKKGMKTMFGKRYPNCVKKTKKKKVSEEVKRDEYGDPIGGPKISKKQKAKNLAANTPDEDHTTATAEGYGSERVGPALTMARAVDKVNPKPKPNSKRTRISRALKMASIKKDTNIRKQKENPYSTDKKLKMVATSIRDRVKQKVKSMAASEDYIPEESKTCGVGEYYCYETKKCKKIPSGYHIGARGYLAKDDDENGKKNGKKNGNGNGTNGNGNGNGNGGNGNGGGNGGGMGESVVREAAVAGQVDDKRGEALKKRQSMIKKQVLMKKLQALRSGGGEDVVAHNELKGDFINELNRYGKETGKATGSMNKRAGSAVKSGGSGKTALNMVRNKIRQETGKPEGQRKKVKGVKDTSAAGRFIDKFKSKKEYESKAKKAGFKSTQAYTDTMARYGGEDNYKKGKGLGS